MLSKSNKHFKVIDSFLAPLQPKKPNVFHNLIIVDESIKQRVKLLATIKCTLPSLMIM